MNNGYITLAHVFKSFPRNRGSSVTVLEDFNLSVRKGEIIGLHGPIGCGKSTILGIAARTIEPDSGTVEIAGKTPCIGDVGFLFQDFNGSLFPWMSCAENIAFSLRLRNTNKKERLDRARGLAEELKLDIDLSKFTYELSGGQQQLIALARALCGSPSALVLDEPFSSLDATVREQVRAKVIEIISSQEVTGIFVSHNLEDCIMISDRILFLTQLPAKPFRYENVNLAGKKTERNVYSDEFADVMTNYRKVAQEARKI